MFSPVDVRNVVSCFLSITGCTGCFADSLICLVCALCSCRGRCGQAPESCVGGSQVCGRGLAKCKCIEHAHSVGSLASPILQQCTDCFNSSGQLCRRFTLLPLPPVLSFPVFVHRLLPSLSLCTGFVGNVRRCWNVFCAPRGRFLPTANPLRPLPPFVCGCTFSVASGPPALGGLQRLPRRAQLLLVSGYLASHNDPKYDFQFFTVMKSRRRRKRVCTRLYLLPFSCDVVEGSTALLGGELS